MATQTSKTLRIDAADSSIAGRIMQIRQMQTELRTRPVTGPCGWLKKLFYKAVRSAFARQFNLNSAHGGSH